MLGLPLPLRRRLLPQWQRCHRRLPEFQCDQPTGAPFDVTGNQFAPQYNVDQDRNRFRVRVRMGAEVDMGENLTAGVDEWPPARTTLR